MRPQWVPAYAWLGTERSLRDVIEASNMVRDAGRMAVLQPQVFFDEDEEDGQVVGQTGLVTVLGNVGVVTIKGDLTNEDHFLNRLLGMVSYGEIRQAVAEAADNPTVESILLNIDSPGGDATGVTEAARFIKTVDTSIKPVYSYTGGAMSSGAYWLGMHGRRVYVAELSHVGSIGVIGVHHEMTEALKEEGVRVTIFRAGRYKAIGNPFEKLTDEAKAELQGRVDQLYGLFVNAVAQARHTDPETVRTRMADGKVYLGHEAVERGLADQVLFFDEVMARLQRLGESATGGVAPQATGVVNSMGRKVRISEKVQAALAAGVPVTELAAEPVASGAVLDTDEGEAAGQSVQAAAPVGGDGDKGSGGTPPPPATTPTQQPVIPPTPGQNPVPPSDQTPPPKAPAAQAGVAPGLVEYLQVQVTARTDEVMTLRMQGQQLQTQLAELQSTRAGLVSIACEAVQRMQIALGGSPMSLEHLSDAALVAEYARVAKVFSDRFKVGGVAQTGDDESEQQPTQTELQFRQHLRAVKLGRGEK